MCHGIVDVSGMSEKMMHSVKQFLTPDMRAFWVVCLAYVVFGGSRWFFGHVPGYMVFLVPIFLIIPLVRPKAGLWAIICLTVLFERFFTLEPLQFGRYALKLYPLDLVLLGMFGGVLVRSNVFPMVNDIVVWSTRLDIVWLASSEITLLAVRPESVKTAVSEERGRVSSDQLVGSFQLVPVPVGPPSH